jgi:plastocyanin domain-containing protein
MKLSLDQKIAVSLLVFLIICLLMFWVLLEKPLPAPDGADEAQNLQLRADA